MDFLTKRISLQGMASFILGKVYISVFAWAKKYVLTRIGQFLEKSICLYESKFFPLRVDPREKGGQTMIMLELLPLNIYQFTFSRRPCICFSRL